MPDRATCNSCRAPILWVTMKKTGRKNPLDAEPTEKGNVKILDGDVAEVVTGDELAKMHEEGELLMISHFATCPNRVQHRKK